MNNLRLSDVLREILGADGMVRLAEYRGGTRLYIPAGNATALENAIGEQQTQALIERFAGSYIRVPLARELRARQYRAAGASNAEIARQLGMTESGVDRLFNAMPNKPAKGSCDPRQGDLFSS